MSEESSTDAPADNAAEGEPTHPRRRRPQRSTLILGTAAVVSAATIAAALLTAVLPAAKQRTYAGIPAPCEVLTAATLAKYLPEATSSPETRSVSTASQVDGCIWYSVAGGQSRSLTVLMVVYKSSARLTDAQREYRSLLSAQSGILGKGATVSTRPVTGLGDQAVSLVITARTFQGGTPPPQIGLVVRSGNADILLNYSTMPIGSAQAPAIAEQVAGTIVMARDVLTALAHPAAVQAAGSASAPLPAGPRYISPRNACALVKASTLAKYVPHAPAGKPSSSSGTPQLTYCDWFASEGTVLLTLTIYSDPQSAQQDLDFQLYLHRQGEQGETFSGAQTVTGLGQQATAIFETGYVQEMWLDAQSGNAEIQIDVQDVPFGPTLSRVQKLAAGIAIVRDVLADMPARR